MAALIGLFLAARMRYPGKARAKLSAANCDADLWKHVYRPERLDIIEPCTAVDGRVVAVHREEDGDLHIVLDPQDKLVLNLVNAIHAHRHLVVESICDHTPAAQDAVAACLGFRSHVVVPQVGDHVRVTGTYVTDRATGWNEIHPVTRVETIR